MIENCVHQQSSSTGTGNFVLDAINGRQQFWQAFATGGSDTFYYSILNQSAQEWEVGTGSLSDATTLVRDTVLASSNGGSLVSFSAGVKDIINGVPASQTVAIEDGKASITGSPSSGATLSVSGGYDDGTATYIAEFNSGVDDDSRVRFRSGSTGNYRMYMAFEDYAGNVEWLLGRNASNAWILYEDGTAHRMQCEPGSHTYISSAGTGAVIINAHPDGSSGSGGLYVRSGGAGSSIFMQVLSSGTTINVPLTVGGNIISTSGTIQGEAFQIQKTGDAAEAAFYISGDAGYNRSIYWRTGAASRWLMRANSTAESGSDTGSDFALNAYSDAGAVSTAFIITRSNRNALFYGALKSNSASGGIGYDTGAGGSVEQGTSRTTGVEINTPCGSITLVSAAGSSTPASFTVTNSAVSATDTVVVSQKSGTDKYAAVVSAVGAGSFEITFWDLTGTTTEQPVFNFAVVKAVAV